MSTTVNVSALSYDSKRDAKVFAELMAKAYTLANDLISVIPNVKTSSVKVNKFGATKSGLVQVDGRDCAWDPNGTLTFADKEVTPANLKVNTQLCAEDLDKILSQATYASVKRGEVPPTIEEAILESLQNAVGVDNESFIWTASVSGGAPLDGIITQAVADAATNSGAGTEFTSANTVTGTTITSANVMGEVIKVYDKIPQAVLDANDNAASKYDEVKIYVSPKTFRFLMQALSSTDARTDNNVQLPAFTKEGDAKNLRIFYLGIEIVKAGVGDNTMFAAQVGNLVLATNLLEDANLRGKMGTNPDTEEILYIKGKYRLAATYVYGTECVLYA